MGPEEAFRQEVDANVARLAQHPETRQQGLDWALALAEFRYIFNFRWMGRPVLQYPQDLVALQELIWTVKPEVIVETGVAHGGSLVFYASMLKLMDLEGFVVGVDLEVRPHNRKALEEHPLASRLRLVEGSSIEPAVVSSVFSLCAGKRALVCLDSNHTHEHVLRELEAYSPLVGVGSYLVVFDTVIEDMPVDSFPDRPWGRGNNPGTAVRAFLASRDDFEVDQDIETRIQLTACPGGFLRRIR